MGNSICRKKKNSMNKYVKNGVVIALATLMLSATGTAYADSNDDDDDKKIVYVPVPGPTVYVPVPGPIQYVNVPGPVQYVNVPGPTVTIEKEKIVEKVVTKEVVKKQIETSIYFKPTSANLTSASRAILDKFIKRANANGIKSFDITGYTDSSGGVKGSFELSLQRSIAVRNYISKRVDGAEFNTVGAGISSLHDNDDSLGRQLNRRVDILANN